MATNTITASGHYILNSMPNVPPPAVQGPQTGLFDVFLSGQPKVLGTIQIMVAMLYVSLGTLVLFTADSFWSFSTVSGISLWAAIFYIISGSLSIAAGHKSTAYKLQGALALNIICSVVSLISCGLYFTDIVNFHPTYGSSYGEGHTSYTEWRTSRQEYVFVFKQAALSFLIVFSLLEFCVSVSLCTYAGRALNQSKQSQVIVIHSNYHSPAGNTNQQLLVGRNDVPKRTVAFHDASNPHQQEYDFNVSRPDPSGHQ